jgi:hypothetical protein
VRAIRRARERSAERALRNESTLQRLDEAERDDVVLHDFVCECAGPGCAARVRLTTREYESVRAIPAHFAVAADHVNLDLEGVIAWHTRFWVVEKRGPRGRVVDLDSERRRRRAAALH